MRPIIRFSERYNKFCHPTFTTIRRLTFQKEAYYRKLVGACFDVFIIGESKPLGCAHLVAMTRSRLSDLPADFLDYDTDQGRYKFAGDMDALILLFCWECGSVPDKLNGETR